MITVESRAKINWYLRILDKRPDGYHNLETVFQEIGLCDRLSFERIAPDECRIDGFPEDVPAETNLITKAWSLMRREFSGQVGGVRVVAQKVIPRGGGLGGGSSNAAATLNVLNTLFELNLSAHQLEEHAALLGSDVPFFIRGGCSVGRGRGELLTPVSHGMRAGLVLLFPGVQVSTREAFASLSTMKRKPAVGGIEAVLAALNRNDAEALSKAIVNDFELTVDGWPWFSEGIRLLEAAGCRRAFLCGSGSTLAGLLSDAGQLDKVLEYLHKTCAYLVEGCVID